ncbi:hypothetical protein [Marinicrinis sediminis]|uniref:Uncharacterized protein n=1 Tax=Marinicrinis sediminis TaxID=1652465 RepID=A0ABW5RDS1_9BACL
MIFETKYRMEALSKAKHELQNAQQKPLQSNTPSPHTERHTDTVVARTGWVYMLRQLFLRPKQHH